jgi:hypothetical protein
LLHNRSNELPGTYLVPIGTYLVPIYQRHTGDSTAATACRALISW